MKELQLWVQADDTKEIVENYILSLIKEDASYYAGNMRVIVHNSENSEQQILSHVYDVSGKTVNTFREHYGDSNIALIERTERESKLMIKEVLAARDMPKELADVITCTDREDLDKKLDTIASIYDKQSKDKKTTGFTVVGAAPGSPYAQAGVDPVRQAMGLSQKG